MRKIIFSILAFIAKNCPTNEIMAIKWCKFHHLFSAVVNRNFHNDEMFVLLLGQMSGTGLWDRCQGRICGTDVRDWFVVQMSGKGWWNRCQVQVGGIDVRCRFVG